MYKKLSLFLFFILITSISLGQDTDTIIVEQPNTPIEIKNYEASFKEGKFSHIREGIHHKIVYMNLGNYNVVAIEFGFVSFNIFNEYLGSTRGIAMDGLDMDETDDGTWILSSPTDFSFYTGIVYVNKVRFENGEIWEADLEVVTDVLKEIDSDFDLSVLTEHNQN